ncbi:MULTISPECIES: sugar phosphate isomerase/epimerase family protein [unclassified Streptomyces]|uniref:sugar phosphate isomerase/epimerase family protein n=1 Tax=unclassified Streptomyces TaxID=2593676 RepID=UPI002DDAD1E5|nr:MULTISPECIES: sugar phosphate isomerase/epimerase family protein [unclassified Streptomyces]WSA90531.1 sugar phosphate isomerase/epimerase [Streptomyces sp. NBC_01795]WSB74856.1 sugar phosphate isomerase/epimerase [Streptomyces sp. NBC_01775]WSS16861.1 sugar phosphate isomerase/epimerase [Streptomyces sp. NBC_01186]WSS45603.1 sugar phosphate isomerase/epimerase [Streptomyces sp. NBC_01187]
MIINTFSYLWSTTAIDAISELVQNGYNTFEVPISSPHCWPEEISSSEHSTILATLNENGAKIRSLNAGGYDINLASPGASMRRKSIEHITSVIDLAVAWDVPEIVISPGTRRPMISPSLENVHGWMHESLEELIPLAKRAGKRLLFENTPYCFAPTIGELIDIVGTVNDDALKIVYDVANAAYIGEDPVSSLRSHHRSVALMHISDTGTETWGHDPIGTGVIDWNELCKAVNETIGVDNVVLEVIREENTLEEFAKAMRDLSEEGWNLGE